MLYNAIRLTPFSYYTTIGPVLGRNPTGCSLSAVITNLDSVDSAQFKRLAVGHVLVAVEGVPTSNVEFLTALKLVDREKACAKRERRPLTMYFAAPAWSPVRAMQAQAQVDDALAASALAPSEFSLEAMLVECQVESDPTQSFPPLVVCGVWRVACGAWRDNGMACLS